MAWAMRPMKLESFWEQLALREARISSINCSISFCACMELAKGQFEGIWRRWSQRRSLSRGDYFSLWLSVQAFQAWGGLPYQKRLPALMRKLQSTSQSLSSEDLERMRKRITFKAGGFQAPVNADIFETVIGACC